MSVYVFADGVLAFIGQYGQLGFLGALCLKAVIDQEQ
jgi:hypothetical protein